MVEDIKFNFESGINHLIQLLFIVGLKLDQYLNTERNVNKYVYILNIIFKLISYVYCYNKS